MRGVVLLLAALASSTTAVAEGPPLAIVLTAGDISRCGAPASLATADLVERELAAASAAGIPAHVVALGDLAYDEGSTDDFDCFSRSWGRPGIRAAMLPVPGNHEYVATPDAAAYFRYFEDKATVTQNGGRLGYFSVPLAENWRLFGLNPYLDRSRLWAEELWLGKALAGASEPCLVAAWHPFVASSLSTAKSRVAQRFLDLVAARHASIVLTGHAHAYEQFGPQTAAGTTDPDGVRIFVVGTGGAPLNRPSPKRGRAPNSEVYDQRSHGVLRIELFPASYRWRFVPAEGFAEIEGASGTAPCNRPKPQPKEEIR